MLKNKKPENDFKVELSIHVNAKLEKMFPQDKNANLKITCDANEYKLNTAHLRLESEFFEKIAEEECTTCNLDSSKFDSDSGQVVEKIMRCLYGGKSIISNSKQLFQSYLICQELRIRKLIDLIEEAIVQNYKVLNFFSLVFIAQRFSIEKVLDLCKDYLISTKFACIEETSKPPSSKILPTSFNDLDASSVKLILELNNENKYLSKIEIFNLLKARSGTDSTSLAQVCNQFLPLKLLTSQEYSYFKQRMSDQEHADYLLSSTIAKESNETGENRIQELESEVIYYQKKINEISKLNEELQSQMSKIKLEINDKTKEFSQSGSKLLNKVSQLEMSIELFEKQETKNKNEWESKIQKMCIQQNEQEEKIRDQEVQLREQEVSIREKQKQIDNLNSILQSFNQQRQPNNNNNKEDKNNTNNQMVDTVSQGFFYKPPEQKNQFKIGGNSVMTVQSYQIQAEGTGGMLYSNAHPLLSNLVSQNTSLVYTPTDTLRDLNQKATKVTKTAKDARQAEKILEEEETKMNEQTNEDIFKGFITFDQPSKVLEDLKDNNLNYLNLLEEFLELNQFKQVKMNLLYNSKRDSFTKTEFQKRVTGASETLILAKSCQSKKVFGGYLSIPWPKLSKSTNESFYKDENAFIFSLSHGLKMPVKNSQYALYQGQEIMFSLGTDDISFMEGGDLSPINVSNYASDYKSVDLPRLVKQKEVLAGSNRFQVDILEVYKIFKVYEEMDF